MDARETLESFADEMNPRIVEEFMKAIDNFEKAVRAEEDEK